MPGRTRHEAFSRTVQRARKFAKTSEALMEQRPAVALLLVGGASFLAGTLLGSRLGRVAIAAAVPLLIRRVFEGKMGQELMDAARDLIPSAEPSRAAS